MDRTTPPAPETALAAALTQVRSVLESVESLDLVGMDGSAVLAAVDEIEGVRRRVESLAARAVCAVEAHGLWALDGARSLAAWYRARTGRSDLTSRREISQARALRDHLPVGAAALAAGEIGPDHASALTRHVIDTPARLARLADPEVGEEFLVEQAGLLDASQYTLLLKRWAIQADPDESDRRWKDDTAREEVFLSHTSHGYDLRGWLSEASGEALRAAIEARIGTPAADDHRTPAQRRASALTSVARLSLDSGVLRPGARIRPHVAVTVPFETLRRLAASVGTSCEGTGTFGRTAGDEPEPVPMIAGPDARHLVDVAPATFADGTPLPHALLARLACGAALHRVVFGPSSEVLDAGREERLFTAGQTRAIVARDGQCRYPGCHAPPGEGEIHHSITWWAEYGPTDTALGVLLCWHHHDVVHARDITIRREGDRWVFGRSDGVVIRDPGELRGPGAAAALTR